MALVLAEGLCKWYADGPVEVRVLEGLDLEVEVGEKIAIVGASGVGKSTLLHILGALDRPSAGRVLFDGSDLFALSDRSLAAFRNREVGFVFQFHHLLGDFTALENVMMPALIGGWRREAARARAEELLARVGLGDRLQHRPGELSGGEQQRVAVARALACRPRLVLADEPTGNLDPLTGEAVHRLLLELNGEEGTTLVVVTHNEALTGAMDRVLSLWGGRLHAHGGGARAGAGEAGLRGGSRR